MLLCERGGAPVTIAAAAREVYDVTGAGDTVVAVFSLALSAGGSPREAAELANAAASVVVSKVGTSTATVEEILEALSA
jgi:D-beta-D-heptose 7-phosphate kinase/D-beta-D-heptose 1-phosphate adenosyltransferase